MRNRDIETTLSEAAREWPGQSVANAVMERLDGERPDGKRLDGIPVRRAENDASSRRRSTVTKVGWWMTAIAASAAIVGFTVVFFSPQTVQAAIRDGLNRSGKAHVLRELFGEEGVRKAEIWFHHEKGIRAEAMGQVLVDDGVESWSWSKQVADSVGKPTVMRRPSMDGVKMIMEMCGGKQIPKGLTDNPSPTYDAKVGNEQCTAYMMEVGTDGVHDLRVIVLIDGQGLPRRLLNEKRVEGQWKKSVRMTIDYEVELRPNLFALDYPKDADVFDVQEAMDGRFPLSKALVTKVKDGVQFAVHDAIPLDDGTYYIVSSVRGTPEYLKKYPPKKRRFNLQYTALDVVQQPQYHCSPCGDFHQLTFFQVEWQGVHYVWWLLAPKGRSEVEPTPGNLELQLFANHLHPKYPVGSKSTWLDMEAEIPKQKAALENVVAKARIDMKLVSAVFGETSSLSLARSMAGHTVQFTSFDEITDEAYAEEMRKAREQMDTWTGATLEGSPENNEAVHNVDAAEE